MSRKEERAPKSSAKLADTIDGIAKELSKFSCVSYLDDLQLSDGLLSGAIRSAAVIACSDMGGLVPYLCSSANVRLYLFQNFGHDYATGGFVETVVGQSVENVVVYGHSVCEYTKFRARAAVDQPTRDLYAVALDSDDEAVWRDVGRFNVLFVMKQLLADPTISPIAEQGRLKVHGWFYESGENHLEVFDPKHRAFIGQQLKLPDSLIVKYGPLETHDRVGETDKF
ncbi:MAG: carbonic anhydrase [Candidatus Obscuribacterales bacterium]|nr:carbonic anhydrase [Candidatus Obscuribacterales bacterium]